jgi:hypothetical protein
MNTSINYSSFLDLAQGSAEEFELHREADISNKLEKKHAHNQSYASATEDAEHFFDT